jgi:tetratricopeptide (TPR) repeat protein
VTRKALHFLVTVFLLTIFAHCLGHTASTAAVALALQNKQYEKALEILRPALASSPGNVQLWAMQGKAYEGEGRTADALASFRTAIKLSPDYLPALQGLAQIQYESGSPAAIPLIEHVLRLQPADPTSHAMLAVLEYQQGNYAAAVPHFEKAGSLFDAQPGALHAYAISLVRLKRFDQAAKVFERTLALDPGNQGERRLLASLQVMANQPGAALATLARLLQAGSPDVATLELASSAYEEAKQTSEAVGAIREAILLDPQNVNLYLDFANISYAHGSFQVGIDVINDGIALQPKAAPLYFARGVFYVQLAQYEKAEGDFATAYDLDPGQSLSTAAQSLAAAQQNDFDRALAKVQTSLVRRPDDPLLLYLQAEIIAQKHAEPQSDEFQLAVRSARRAVALRPTLGPAQGVLGKLSLQSGNYHQAALECRKALESDPKDQAALYHLIQALRKTGASEEIPALLKRLAVLRQQAQNEERDRYRFKLVEGGDK